MLTHRQMDCDVVYKCGFCNVMFIEVESMLKHNKYYCHKRKSLPSSSTVTTAVLSNPQSPGRSKASQDRGSASHPFESVAGMSHSESKSVPTSEYSPPMDYSKDTTMLQHKHIHSRVPGAAASFKPEAKVVIRINQEHMQQKVPEDAADFKHPTSDAITFERLYDKFRDAANFIHPTSAAITLQRLHAFVKDKGAVTDFKHPTSSAAEIQRESMYFKVPESAADGRLTRGASPLKRERVDSNERKIGEDSEIPESGIKRRKLLDEDESA